MPAADGVYPEQRRDPEPERWMMAKDPKDDLMFFPRLRRNMRVTFIVISVLLVILFIVVQVAK